VADAAAGARRRLLPVRWVTVAASDVTDRAELLLRVAGLAKTYRRRALGGRRTDVTALDGVDLTIAAGSTVALIGESAAGKSTLARCVALLEAPSAGEIWLDGVPVSTLDRRRRAALRPRVQWIAQDPAAALNPRLSAIEAVAEPLRIARRGDRRERRRRALEWMAEAGFEPELAQRRPLELSGGQRQRLVIARALAAEPRLLILDESLAALDLSLRARIVNLLLDLQLRFGLAYLLIAHDLRTAVHLADEVAVMDRGRIVERAAPPALLARPRHAATRALVSLLPAAGS
jgi:ABC-type glutathione transport system ATPase component